MTKRPPEMVELERYIPNADGPYIDQPDEWVDADKAESAIRSLRVKLFRERAKLHDSRMEYFTARQLTNPESEKGLRRLVFKHAKAGDRFSRIADAIERGER